MARRPRRPGSDRRASSALGTVGASAFRPAGVGNRRAGDLAGAAGRGLSRLDAGADVDAVRFARAACDRRRAVADCAGRRRSSWRSNTKSPSRVMIAILAPQLPLAYLAACFAVARARRGDVPDWRGVFGSALPDRGRPAAAARPFRLARPRASVVRVAAAWPVAAGCGWASCCRSSWPCSSSPATSPVLVFFTLLGVLLTPPFMAGFVAATVSQSNPACARFLRPDAVHRDAAADQRRARRRQAEGDDLEHARRVAAGARRHPARRSPCRAPAGGDRTASAGNRARGDAPRDRGRAAGDSRDCWPRRGSSSCRACTSA